ncbi:MAG: acetate--CoA ligase family protein [Gammaproteobacteria bacterium]|nr:acetate--CoA ligase family protein [Gammaproteobacteria bacterium]
MAHRLDPLLRPRSIAVLGASQRPGSVGCLTVRNLVRGAYAGALYAINPRYTEVEGVPCVPSLDALPAAVEHVIFALADESLEAALEASIAHGVRAVTIMSALVLDTDREPVLKDRVAARVRSAGLLVCGGNGMGFYNFHDRIWACGFDTRDHAGGGPIALISHSGAGMSGILDVDARLDFNLAVSTGQELVVAMDEYLDFALELPGTRVVGLFMETVRNPAGLRAALAKANALGIPIVALKVGRTAFAAELAVSHSGALAGDDAAYDALFDRYGVQRVTDMDELATALAMFAQPHPVGAGGLVSLHDSGGERQLTIDLAASLGVPLTKLAPATVTGLGSLLDPGLPAVNPLDAWSRGGTQFHLTMSECLTALLADPGAAIGAVIHDRAREGAIYPEYLDYLRVAHETSGKPVFLVSNRQGTGADPRVIDSTRAGLPVLDGLRGFLCGARCLFDYRDFRDRAPLVPPAAPAHAVAGWRARLHNAGTLEETVALALCAEFGVPVIEHRRADDEQTAIAAALEIGYPVALKTAAPGIVHKSDVDGVRLSLHDVAQLRAAYRDFAARLGPQVIVARMAPTGVEMILGIHRDPQFGPLVALGFGGVHAELLGDIVFALPPFDVATAFRLADRLRLRPLLEGVRGSVAADIGSFCAAAARLSVLATELADRIVELDLNPVIVHPHGCVAVDALVLSAAAPDPAVTTGTSGRRRTDAPPAAGREARGRSSPRQRSS